MSSSGFSFTKHFFSSSLTILTTKLERLRPNAPTVGDNQLEPDRKYKVRLKRLIGGEHSSLFVLKL
jgi:hypothetical protein